MAVPKLSKYIIRVSMMILTKNKRAKVVEKTVYMGHLLKTHLETTTR